MHERGFRGVSMDDVAAAAGVKKANLFHYYPSKNELGLAVLDYAAESLQQKILGQFEGLSGAGPVRAVEKIFDESIRGMTQNRCCKGCLVGNLAQELSDHNEKFRRRIAGHFEFWTSQLAAMFSKKKAAGEFGKEFKPRESAEAILALLEGATLFSKTYKSIDALKNARKAASAYLRFYQTNGDGKE